MNKVTWVIQTNLIDDIQMNKVWYSAIDAGAEVQEAVVIPFLEELGNEADIPAMEGVVIPYGSCKLTRISQERNWRGNCYVDETFRTNVWNENRDDMLNADSFQMQVKDTSEFFKDTDENEKWFIRPVKDLKTFSGTVCDVADIKTWMKSTESGNFSFTEDTEIIVAPVKKLFSEARFFVVGGKVVDGSYYRMGGRLISHHIVQEEVLQSAQELANGWLPHECCVMDVADTEDGIKIIEWNTLNSSGFYSHDISKIVKAMTNWARNLPPQ